MKIEQSTENTYDPNAASDSDNTDHDSTPFHVMSSHVGLEEEVGHDEPN